MSEDDYLRKQTIGSFLPPPYKDITSIFPSNLVVDTFPLTLVSGQNKTSKSTLGRISSSNILREKVSGFLFKIEQKLQIMDIEKMILLVISLTILLLEFAKSGKSTYFEYLLIAILIKDI